LLLSRQEGWEICARTRRRLLAIADRMGLAHQAEDLVHDTFLTVMQIPRLYRNGFNALLNTVLWRRCTAVARRQALESRVSGNARLLAGDQPDHADSVVDRLHARWVVGQCANLHDADLRILDLVGQGCSYRAIAALTDSSSGEVGEALRSARNRARRQLHRIGVTAVATAERQPGPARGTRIGATPPIEVFTSYHAGVGVVRPVGRLDVSTQVGLRDALLKAAADNPTALIVDMDHLIISTPVLYTLFMVVSERIGEWPGIPLLLLAGDTAVLAALRSTALRRTIPIHNTLAGVLAAADLCPPYRYRRLHLPASPPSVGRARLFTTEACSAWNIPHMLDDAVRIVAALVDNAVTHARTPIRLRLTEQNSRLRISVRDQSHPLPGTPPRPESGLGLVDRRSTRWGSMPTPDGGKAVWALLEPTNAAHA
jgi:DNA-directed RNA polymerase specialized sigma24 family protein